MFIKNFRKLLLFRKKCDKIRKEDYFSKKESAYAIKIEKATRYKRARSLKEFNVNYPPQSFMYLAWKSLTNKRIHKATNLVILHLGVMMPHSESSGLNTIWNRFSIGWWVMPCLNRRGGGRLSARRRWGCTSASMHWGAPSAPRRGRDFHSCAP